MQNIKVSIIIPVYNTADYLHRCLDSCVNQTLQEIEVVVVNDCSPDLRDGEIMREYERRFPDKVRCFWHKENKRQGGAKSTGIRSACGEFIYCLDSDDYIDLTLCEKMYNAAIAENADMAVCDTNRIENNIVTKNWMSNGKFNTSDLCERIKNIKNHSLWVIMIKKSVIENNNLYLLEQTEFDDYMSLLWYLASKKIVRVNEALHYYYVRKNSVVQEKKLQTFVSTIELFKFILSSDYFNNLDIAVKKSLFLYLVKWIPDWCQIICVNYSTEFVNFCNSILDIFKIYKVNYDDNIYAQQENGIRVRDILCFIELNIGLPDFYFEFLAFWNTYCVKQNKVMQLKKLHSCISSYIGKRLTIWGCGYFGKRNAENMNLMGIEFEITDVNTKIHGESIANAVVKPWDEIKERTDVVLVSVLGFFEDIRDKLAKECPNIETVNLTRLLEQ